MPWIDNCLGSINFSRYKVVVVDNNSTDDTVTHIKSNYSEVVLFQQDQNLGFGKANNIGISYALKQGAEQVFLLNQDAYIVEDALEKLIEFQKKNIDYGIVSPIHVNANKSKLDRNFSNYVNFNKNPHFYSDYVLGNKLRAVYDVPFVNAAGWLISKNCLMKVGGFDPIFFHYGEDDNYCQRLSYHGFKIGILPKCFLVHDREERKKPTLELYSKEYYVKELRKFKVIYANVNTFESIDYRGYINKFRRQSLKALLKRDLKKFRNLKAYLKNVNQTIPQIQNSVSNNIKAQPNYLEI
jgi:GT2 family glycosyltransferase